MNLTDNRIVCFFLTIMRFLVLALFVVPVFIILSAVGKLGEFLTEGAEQIEWRWRDLINDLNFCCKGQLWDEAKKNAVDLANAKAQIRILSRDSSDPDPS